MELLFPLLLLGMLAFLFLGNRRQRKAAADMQASLKVGTSVVTTSGLYGTIVDVDEDTVDLEIAEDVVTTWSRAAIGRIRPEETDTADEIDTVGATDTETVTADTETVVVEESPAQTETRLTKD
ncbi:preprotein translocase subunit YajC [Nocardia sp. NPDC050712]|uniref:preprotein translocase subunit YajC n=1 Tax=Nocardia sp. NPDC050712 TaxID=3155518 RepID=UPI0034102D5C